MLLIITKIPAIRLRGFLKFSSSYFIQLFFPFPIYFAVRKLVNICESCFWFCVFFCYFVFMAYHHIIHIHGRWHLYIHIRILKTQIRFQWNIFNITLIIRQHWFKQWLSAEQSTSHCLIWSKISWFNDSSLRWRHNGHDGVSNHQPNHCLLNRLFGCR